ncbi:MAG: ribonuclease P protein component [Oscillospiraceae bacterium]|nr:ribonuclease P protein component [Oscillospiraceae bacterium]
MRKTVSLSANRDFRRLYARGRNTAGSCLAVYCARNRLGLIRLGLTVSTKLGGAVQRNRIRRRIKEAYRLQEGLFVPGYDIVVVARFRAKAAPFSALQGELLLLSRRLGIARQ